jgi:chaperonin cofactor prefoldin
MSDKVRNYEQELANLMDNLAESVFEMSDDEARDEMKENGESTDYVRSVLRQAVKDHRQNRLVEAQQRYDERVAALSRKKFSLPSSIQEMREMLNSVLTSNPAVGDALLTAQYRDFNDLPDEEVPGYLRQLFELGVLNDITATGDDE